MRQIPENINMLLEKPSVLIKNGRNFVVVNARNHMSAIQNDIPNSFNLPGITSEIIRNGSGKMAHEAEKIASENDANGIQLNVSTQKPHDFSIIYTPKVQRPIAVPIVLAAYKNCQKQKRLIYKIF